MRDLNINKCIDDMCAFLSHEFKKAGFNKAVLGLSGGLDSAVVAFLAVKSLGRENVVAIKLPYKTSSEESIIDADLVIEKTGMPSRHFEITPVVDKFAELSGCMNPLRMGNVMARIRMTVLFDKAMAKNALVLGTSNKSEILLGYGTLFGDMASIINPIAPFYKTEIKEIAKELGVPVSIINKKPSADLWQDQEDEKELGFTYAEADEIMYLVFDTGNREAAIDKFGFNLVEKVTNRVTANEYKSKLPIKFVL
ncbi:MAG: NAD+ synthase [Candidatus Delongbacteria bacterium]|nr:NAD+ synthase [Candidatus Delongbacteria bacterium]MBN2833419.1 NAD+ synthase [Candidatus Delongbacteria bacterium]